MRKNSIKNTRINGEVQEELSNIIRNEIKDPRIGMMTSVTAAEVAPDLKTCKVYISVFGDDEAKKETIRGLKSAEGFIRRMLAKTINLRNTPELTFVLDESIEYGVTMSKLIDEVTHKEAGAWPPRRAGPPDCVRHDRRIPAELRRRFHRQSAGDQSGQDGGLPRRSGRGNADQAGCLIRQEKKEGRYRYAYYVRTRQVRKRSL